MKDSSVSFIGEIPENWHIIRNKNVFSCTKCLVGEESNNTQLLSLTKRGVKKKDINNAEGKLPESFDTYQYVSKDDIVMCLFDLDVSAVFSGISAYNGMISPAYKIMTCKSNLVPKFADYWFQYISDGRKFNHYSKNIRYTLSFEDFSTLPIVLPSYKEQNRIANYLDEKCTKIDNIIAKQQAVIEKLKEYKQAVITEAVTKGLDPNAQMKDSGVEWIGKIPEHWKIIKLKYVSKIIRGKFGHRPRNDPRYYDGEYPFIQTGDVARSEHYIQEYKQTLNDLGYSVSRQFPKGSIVMAIAANIGDVAVLDFDACFPDSVVGFIPQNIVNLDYLYYSLKSMKNQFLTNAIISTQLNLNIDIIKEEYIVLPTLDEQKNIILYIERNCNKINLMIKIKQELIEKLVEYKKSFIYEVITGKKEV